MGSLVLTAVLERLDEYDWDDTLFVPAKAMLSPDVPVEIIKLRDDQPAVDAIPGFKYLLEVGVIRDELDDMDALLMRPPTAIEKALGVIHYAEHDAHIALSQLRKHLPAPLGFAFREPTIIHTNPAWSDQMNTVIDVHHIDDRFPGISEELSVREVGDRRYEICCVPFLGTFALGDTLILEHDGDGSPYWRRCKSAGHSSHRLLLKYAGQGAADEITAELQKEKASFEWYSPEFLAMSRSDPLSYSKWYHFFMRVRKEYGVIVFA